MSDDEPTGAVEPPHDADREAPEARAHRPHRPADPAGTRPKVDVDRVMPAARSAFFTTGERPAGEPRTAAVAAAAQEGALGEDGEILREAPHAARFQFLTGALLAVAAVAIVGLIWAVAQGGGGSVDESWSPWQPSKHGMDAAQQIADHVAPEYKGTDSRQLVYAQAGDLRIADIHLDMVERETPAEGGEVKPLSGRAVLFKLCGLDDACRIPGKPSGGRMALLRREAVEMASYAFHYISRLKYAVFFLPPSYASINAASGKQQKLMLKNQTLVFRRGDLEPTLDAPLRATLKAPAPSAKTVTTAPDFTLVDSLATRAQFFFTLSQGSADDHAYLVLDRDPQQSTIDQAKAEAQAATASAAAAAAATTTTKKKKPKHR